ncbi:MAG: hypothetical protein K2O97_08700, partial [Acetatifactor sp.]|nr:hypothetical protein [Acetatifactor sp.]
PGTIYANAHNEWLNTLVNLGILGVAALAGIYIGGMKRYRKVLLGMLVIAMYGINSLISFQQVLSTPLLFMVLGLCEYQMRSRDEKGSLNGLNRLEEKAGAEIR